MTRRGKVLIINQFYEPDISATAQMVADLARFLASRGFEVSVVTGRASYCGRGESLPRSERRAGVKIFRVGPAHFERASSMKRLYSYLCFLLAGAARSLFLNRQDLVITLSTPPFISLVGWLLKTLRGCKHFIWTMDIYPDVAFRLGVLKRGSLLGRELDLASRFLFRSADAVVAIGGAMAGVLQKKGVEPSRISVISNWASGSEVYPLDRNENRFRRKLGLDGSFVVGYTGNIGMVHSFDVMLRAARTLKTFPGVSFLFVGQGGRLPEVLSAREREGLKNIIQVPRQPRQILCQVLSAPDVHIVSLREGLAGLSVPSKFYGALAAGRPVIFIGPPSSEIARWIRRSGCGFALKENDVAGFTSCIEFLKKNPAICERMGRRARRYFLRNFERERCCEKWEKLLRRHLKDSPG